jgi:hypothetical protein
LKLLAKINQYHSAGYAAKFLNAKILHNSQAYQHTIMLVGLDLIAVRFN